MPGTVVSVREGERFDLPPELNTPGYRERIIRYTDGFPFDVVTLDRRGLRAGNVVGSVRLGKLRLEILPKASATSRPEEDARFLLDLLAGAGLVSRSVVAPSRVRYVRGAAIEPVVAAYAARLLQRLSDGLPRRYSTQEERSTVLRGRVDFSVLAREIPGRNHVLPIRFAPLQPDNPLTRLVRAVVQHLLGAAHSMRSRSTLLACDQLLGGVPRVPLAPEAINRIHLTSLEAQWQDVVDLATALVNGKAPDPTSAGSSHLFSMVFAMDDVFERIVLRNLTRALSGSDVALAARPVRLYLLHSTETGKTALPLRPDFLFVERRTPAKPLLVGDAKWKRLDPTSGSLGLKPADVYQLTTYMASHHLERGLFFFPRVEGMADGWSREFCIAGRRATIQIISVDTPSLVSAIPSVRERSRRALGASALRNVINEPAETM